MDKLIDQEIRNKLLEEHKYMTEEYRYREILMVTEFSLSITGLVLAVKEIFPLCNKTLRLICLILISLIALAIANHMQRLNQDRLRAGKRIDEINALLYFYQPHAGFAKRRSKIRIPIPAPKLMVILFWTITFFFFITTLVFTFKYFFWFWSCRALSLIRLSYPLYFNLQLASASYSLRTKLSFTNLIQPYPLIQLSYSVKHKIFNWLIEIKIIFFVTSLS